MSFSTIPCIYKEGGPKLCVVWDLRDLCEQEKLPAFLVGKELDKEKHESN